MYVRICLSDKCLAPEPPEGFKVVAYRAVMERDGGDLACAAGSSPEALAGLADKIGSFMYLQAVAECVERDEHGPVKLDQYCTWNAYQDAWGSWQDV